ncbi:RHS repeat-associated core domain-containing protein [Sorangium sp. So ce1000]|uniref:RHS repeat-associated core domain-containing protein n=1 Tax=Sorangium sp. So ce1000 TaxID=3133325 RepID=UPI003F6077D9
MRSSVTCRSPGPCRRPRPHRDTGLVRLGARDYDPRMGQWTAKDPILLAFGINVYGCCGNDPINYIDSTGMAKWRVARRIG